MFSEFFFIMVLNRILLKWKYEIQESTKSDFKTFEVINGINIFEISLMDFVPDLTLVVKQYYGV